MTARRLLFLGTNYRPEPIGIGPYTAGLAEALAARGHTVEVVTGQPHYPEWQVHDGYGAASSETICGVTVHRVPHYVPARPGGAKRIAHYIDFAARTRGPLIRRAKALRPDAVVAVLPSLFFIPTAATAARKVGAHLWAHVQDFEVEAAFATGQLPSGGLIERRALAFEASQFRRPGTVSTISPAMAARLASKGVAAERILELRNWANHVDSIAATDGRSMRETLGIEEKTLVLYSGSIARKQGMDVLMDAARKLSSRPDIAFVVCGPAEGRAALEAEAGDLSNIRFIDLVPAEEVGALLKAADVHVLPQIAGAADLVLPSKLTNMLASGRPVVATAAPGTGLAQEVEGCGLITPPGDAAALAEAIGRLADDPEERARLGAAAERQALARWTIEAAVVSFENRLDAVLD